MTVILNLILPPDMEILRMEKPMSNTQA